MRTHPSPARPARLRRSILVAAVALAIQPMFVHGATFSVASALDSGIGSLRQAIIDANAQGASCASQDTVIEFRGGPFTIAVSAPLPAITCARTTINASQVDGFVLDGIGILMDACGITGSAITPTKVHKVAIRNFDYGGNSAGICGNVDVFDSTITDNWTGIVLGGTGLAQGNMLAGNFDGIRLSGAARAVGNTLSGLSEVGIGIRLQDTAEATGNPSISNFATGIRVEGSARATGNTLSNIFGDGIFAYGGAVVSNNTITGAGASGITAYNTPSITKNRVSDASIGILVNGSAVLVQDNQVHNNRSIGIRADNDATVDANFVSGNPTGIELFDAHATGNFVGTVAGANPNGVGIADVLNGALYGVGGKTISGNVIGGNTQSGILLSNRSSTVSGNFIGVNNSLGPIEGNSDGILLEPAATGYTIEDNVIANSSNAGIYADRPSNLAIRGNTIGTNGTAALPNSVGIETRCGGSTSITGNTVSGNKNHGLLLAGLQGDLEFTQVTDNFIGTNLGRGTGIPNGGAGIMLASALCLLPDTAPKALRTKAAAIANGDHTNYVAFRGNTIAYNSGGGIVASVGIGNHWFGNLIHSNTGKNIDLSKTLPTDVKDADDGPNGGQNTVEITAVEHNIDGTTRIFFKLDSEPADSGCPALPPAAGYVYRVDFFTNTAATTPAGRTPLIGAETFLTGLPCGGEVPDSVTRGGQIDFISATVQNVSTRSSSEFSAIAAALTVPAVDFNPPLPVSLGPVPVGGTGTRAVTLMSTGGRDWGWESFSADPTCGRAAPKVDVSACAAPFTCDSDCALRPYSRGTTCTLNVAFRPDTVGTISQTIFLCDNAHALGHAITLQGEGTPAAVATVTPNIWDFGSVRLGQKSLLKSFSVVNNNPVETTIGSITLTTGFVHESTSCPIAPAKLAPSASCEVIVSFRPVSPGRTTGTIRLASGGGGFSDGTASLQGVGTEVAEINLPVSLDFATYTLGSMPITRSITITNTGNTDVVFSSIAATAPWTLTHGCGTALPPNASCTFSLSFAPTAEGPYTGSLTVSSNAQGSGSVALTGTAQAAPVPLATLSSGTLDLGRVPLGTTGSPGSITLTSTGTAPYVIGKFSADSSCSAAASVCSSGEFLCSLGCNPGESYAPGSSCTISARFAPRALGLRSTTFFICDNTMASPRAVTIQGEGTNPLVVAINPGAHDFGVVPVGQVSAVQTFGILNTSGQSVSIATPFVSANYRLLSHTCPASLAPAQRCAADVAFAPTLAGRVPGQLVVQSSGAGTSSAFAALTGTGGTQPVLDLPTAVDFGTVQAGTGSMTRAITVANAGNAAMTLTGITLAGTHYSMQNECPSSVAAGSSCVVRVTFAPSESGEFNGSLTVAANVGGGPRTVSLTGRAQPRPIPLVRVNPANMGFGDRQIGSQSAPQRVTVSNVGGAAAAVDRIDLGPDFVIAANTCGGTIPAQQSCSIDVALRPVGFGPRTGRLQIFTNSEGSPHTVNLTGTGCRPFTPGSRNSGRNAACAP